ncbi:hypothetical protein QM091_09350 [Enterobacter roggenkampii]|uniref:hypothetical protein n=1 Tax=Enterobacter roggenkampii TaxID=1812935 RepID=UPI00294A5FFA|nr:hypothetical protein [Enterobacter roggenkampii]MDV5319047.1 hypothetical protein [Enterobacter roggenkampii]MDV5328994.1 hypothetical protein [Enterobacter roggenkampii]MDV5679984.1 hypothetical protein [Enterobacter roggenkampii]
MSTITREQLRARAREKVKSLEFSITQTAFADSRAELEEELELARIELASLEAEPVAWLLSGGGAKNNVSFDSGNAYADPLREVTPLYTAPPAPVSVPDAMEMDDDFDSAFEHGKAVGWNAYRAAMLQSFGNSEQLNSPVIPDCSCRTCRPVTFSDSRFVVCPECGNKRCPHANDHRNACTGSNEPGQEGSAYPAAPQQEVK